MQEKQGDRVRLQWELPLGVVRGYLEEPGPRFVDPYAAAEREAIQAIEQEADLEIKKRKKRNANTTTE